MRILSKRTLRTFWEEHPQAAAPISIWYARVAEASWNGPADVKRDFNSVDFVADNRAVFNIGGNKYRLVAYVAYKYQRVFIKFIGTHAAYDKIDPERI